MNLNELYLLVENDEKIYNDDKKPDFVNDLIKQYKEYKKDGGDTVCHIKFHPYEGRIYWIELLLVHEVEYSLYMWRQIRDFLGSNKNIFSYMFNIIDKYNIICDCVNDYGTSHFMDKFDKILKNEIPNYINKDEYDTYALKEKCKAKGLNYDEEIKKIHENRKKEN